MHSADDRSALLLPDGALVAVPDDLWRRLALRLDALGIDEDMLRRFDFLGPDLGDSLRLPLQQWKAREEGSATSLAIAFLRLQEAVTGQELEKLFGMDLATEMNGHGLFLVAPDDCFRFALRLGALEGKFILSDRNLFHSDSVMGASAATARIHRAVAVDGAAWTDDGTLLDLGCGGGALALALGSVAQKVYGCDISGRAVCLARVNAALNACDQTEQSPQFQQGDLFAPFAGCRFSRIVCQPPFIPDVGGGATFASGGPLGDAVTLRILRHLGQHLLPRGRAVLCVEWASTESQSWQQRVQSALNGQGLMGIHCQLFRTPAEDYCALLAPYLCPVGSAEYNAFLKTMLQHYHDHGIEAIDLVLHFIEPARGDAELQAVREVPLTSLDYVTAGYGDRAIAALVLASSTEEVLLRSILCPPEGFAVTESNVEVDGFAEVAFAPESLLPGGQLPAQAVTVLEAASGSLTASDVLLQLPGESSDNMLLIRQMLAQGLLFGERNPG